MANQTTTTRTPITATFAGSSVTLDATRKTIEIAGPDPRGGDQTVVLGQGRWDGELIECAVDLGDEIYDGLDEALSEALGDEPRLHDYYVWVGFRNAGGGLDEIGDTRTVRAESAQEAADLVAAEYDDGEVACAESLDFSELASATAEQADHD